jgi:predicted secreted Zn-dependent protease
LGAFFQSGLAAFGGFLAIGTGAMAQIQDTLDLPEVEHVPVEISVTYYDVEGRRYRDVVEAMRFTGPLGYDAETHSSFSYYFETARTSEGCGLSYLEFPLTVEIQYPNWTDYERARRSDREAWDRRMHVLSVHENIHALIAFLGTVETYNDMIRVGTQPDCSTLESRLRDATEQANERLQTWQRDYDSVTEHGQEQQGFDLQAFMSERL